MRVGGERAREEASGTPPSVLARIWADLEPASAYCSFNCFELY